MELSRLAPVSFVVGCFGPVAVTSRCGLETAMERTGIEPVTSGLQRRHGADLGGTARDETDSHSDCGVPLLVLGL